jgi:glycosyltransferase involved in cell wall biosynthesis
MKIKADTVILLPAKNEQAAIGKVIDDIHAVGYHNIVVAVSGCTDNTAQVAIDHGSQVIDCPNGKGRAVNYALKRIDAKKVVMLDSDATYPVKSIPSIIDKLESYQVVAGTRKLNSLNMPVLNRMGNTFITYQARFLHGLPIKDLCTGMWGFRGDVIKKLDIQSYGFTLEAELFIFTARNRLTFGQIPIEYYPRIGQKKINRMDHLKIMWYLWTRSFT